MGVKMKKKKDSTVVFPIFPEEIREKSPFGKYSPRAAAVEGFQSLVDLFKNKKGTKKKIPKKKITKKKSMNKI